MNQIAIRDPGTRSVLIDMSDRYGMEPAAFEATLRATVVPGNCTREQFAAFLLVAKEYKLNPLLKEIYAFPSKGGIQPIVGVDGWANLINSHPAFDGMDFEDHLSDARDLVSITCKMHRKDRSHPITATEYLSECKRATEPWQKWPRRMLRHKAMIQAARYAFSFAGIIDPDEAERFAGEFAQDVTPRGSIVPISQRIADKFSATDAHKPSDRAETVAAPNNGGCHDQVTENQSSSSNGNASGRIAGQAGGMPAPDSYSSQPASSPPIEVEANTPATEAPQMPDVAGTNSELSSDSSLADDDAQAGADHDKPGAGLPLAWERAYIAALKRSRKKDSLPKYAQSYWEQYGGWAAYKSTPDGETASIIYNAFTDNFDDESARDEILREIAR